MEGDRGEDSGGENKGDIQSRRLPFVSVLALLLRRGRVIVTRYVSDPRAPKKGQSRSYPRKVAQPFPVPGFTR